jgi:type VI secretion system ImpM family protein
MIFDALRGKLSSPKKVEPAVSVYGKLPFYKDFLRSSLAGKEAQAVKQWLDRGFSHYWGANQLYSSYSIDPHGFLLRFPGTGKQVLGYLWGSHDQGKLRHFPFALFVALPAGKDPVPSLATIAALGQLITHARRLRYELNQMTSVESFYGWSRRLKVALTIHPELTVEAELADELCRWTVEQLATTLYQDHAAATWPALLAYIKRHQEQVQAGVHGISLAVRLPSTETGLSILQQVQMWCRLLGLGSSRKDPPMNLLVPLYEGRPGIIVLQRRLRPEDIYALHPEMPEYEFVEDLRAEVPRSREQSQEAESKGFEEMTLDQLVGIGTGKGD